MKSLRIFVWYGVLLGALFALFLFRSTIQDAGMVLRGLLVRSFDPAFSYVAFETLRAENEMLKAEIVFLRGSSTPAPTPLGYRQVRVYSRYPFNDMKRFLVDRGSADGIVIGMPVFFGDGIALGTITHVDRTRAEVQTVFDPAWKSSVSIGTSGVKAVLEGGTLPRLSLIPERAELSPGQAVRSSGPEFPLGAFWGTVGDIATDTHDAWQTATLAMPYREEFLESVLIPTNYP